MVSGFAPPENDAQIDPGSWGAAAPAGRLPESSQSDSRGRHFQHFDAAAAPQKTRGARRLLTPAAITLAALLVTNAPLHVCAPLTADTVLYDLQARNLLAGGVLYRDIFETNLPGIVWLHVVLRSLVGWSSETLRLVDLAIFGSVVWLMMRLLRRCGCSVVLRAWTAALLLGCYFSVSEWCHCQRDTWMLLPALTALLMRARQLERLGAIGMAASVRTLYGWALLEGLCWAAAFWIKPFVAVPAAACLLVTAIVARGRTVAIDIAGILTGGLAAGAAGAAWLAASGAWPHFLETFLQWNPDYVTGGRARWSVVRLYGMGYRLFPWILLHAVAAPLAVQMIRRVRRMRAAADGDSKNLPPLLAAFYLAWLFQTVLLQQPFDYIQLPPILLAISIIAAWSSQSVPLTKREAACSDRSVSMRSLAATAFIAAAAVTSPALEPGRLACWFRCFGEGSSAAVRDRLAYARTPDFQRLEDVIAFLRAQQVRDGEVTCFHVHLIHVYERLGLKTSTRYVGLEALMRLFPRHRDRMEAAVAGSRQRFVVTDLVEAGMSLRAAEHTAAAGPPASPPALPDGQSQCWPWSLPVVYRSGRYLVHAVLRPAARSRSATP